MVDVLLVATIAWGGEDRIDMLADRAGQEADAGGIQEVVGAAAVSDLLGMILRRVRSNKKVLEVGRERDGCRISIDIGICQEEDRKLPYCISLLS